MIVMTMDDNVLENFSSTDITICSAAVSDFKPKNPVNKKIKKETGFNNIEFIPNKDILLEISKTKSLSQTLVGFALESDNERNNAISKLTTKNLDLVVLNSLNDKDAGFGIDTNKITLIMIITPVAIYLFCDSSTSISNAIVVETLGIVKFAL